MSYFDHHIQCILGLSHRPSACSWQPNRSINRLPWTTTVCSTPRAFRKRSLCYGMYMWPLGTQQCPLKIILMHAKVDIDIKANHREICSAICKRLHWLLNRFHPRRYSLWLSLLKPCYLPVSPQMRRLGFLGKCVFEPRGRNVGSACCLGAHDLDQLASRNLHQRTN